MAAARGLRLAHLAPPRRPASCRGAALGSRVLGVLQLRRGKHIPVRAWFRHKILDTVENSLQSRDCTERIAMIF